MAKRSRLTKAGSGTKKVNRLTTVTTPKFKVGQKVAVAIEDDTGNTTVGFGKIKNKQFVWYPEYWGAEEGAYPEWMYSVETTKDSPEDCDGNYAESAVSKFDPKDW
jgi:hypothetical protein